MVKYSNSAAQSRLDDYNYEMYTNAGNRAITTQLRKIIRYIEKGRMITPEVIETKIETLLKTIEVKHPEVWDTEPHWHIRWNVAKCLEDNYFDHKPFNLVNNLK